MILIFIKFIILKNKADMSQQILFKEQNEKLFFEKWQNIVEKINASPRYLPASLKNYLLISKNKSLFHSDKSFIYLINNEPVAGVFLPIEKKEDNFIATIIDDYIDAPLLVTRSIEKNVFALIDNIAKENKLAKIMFLIDPLEKDTVTYNYLQKYNYLDTSILSYVIDLEKYGDLLNNCRKGHRCDIKHILSNKDFKVFFIDKDNPVYEIHEEYRMLHHKCSGRVTRPKETFDLQFENLKQGHAVLFGLKYKGKNIAYSYFEYHTDKAAYTSAADDPDYNEFPLYHTLIFSAMEYLKKRGVRLLDVEPPCSPSLQVDYYPDQKQLNIASFKAGFGGYFVHNFRGIKYFSKKIFKEDMKNFVSNYLSSPLAPFYY